MTGFDHLNHTAFHEATQTLRERGYWVLNPARQPPGLEYATYFRRAIKDIYKSSGLALLPGWEISPGASQQFYTATRLGLESRPVDDWEPLEQAHTAISSEYSHLPESATP